jgi:hypothetical protein
MRGKNNHAAGTTWTTLCRWRMLRSGTTNRSELPPCRETGNRALILPQLWNCSQPEGGVNRWGGVHIFTPHS